MKETGLKIYLTCDIGSKSGIHHIFTELEDFTAEVIDCDKLIQNIKHPHLYVIMLSRNNSDIVQKILKIKNPRKDRYFFLVNDFSVQLLAKLSRRGFNKIYVLPEDINDFKSAIMTEVQGLNLSSQDYYSRLSEDEYIFRSLIGGSDEDLTKIKKIKEAAKTQLNFIIQGELGLGKSRLSRTIHKYSGFKKFIEIIPSFTADGPFTVHIEADAESKFFDDLPDFEISRILDNSSVFIKNVNEIEIEQQKRILRILQNKGAAFRTIATTTETLEDLTMTGKFLDEFYYQLNGSYIELLPLRFRQDDLQHIFNHLVVVNSKKLKKRINKIDSDVFEFVKTYPWLGNIQELDNAIVNAITFSSNNLLSLTDFANIIIRNTSSESFSVRSTDVLPNTIYLEVDVLSTKLDELNRKYADVVLRKFDNNKSKVADILGITRPTLKKLTE